MEVAQGGAMTAPYDGTNCDLREPHCVTCGTEGDDKQGENSAARLMRCSRCGVVMYCGVECQKTDYPRHKKECRSVQRGKEKMEQEAEALKNFSAYGEEPSNLFETQRVLETRDYMRARMSLMTKLTDLARETQTKDAWSIVADHILECLRLNMTDNNGLRYAFPFFLLRLNRDDDAYCFCKYWATPKNFDDESAAHISSKEGDWIYAQQEGCRYLDVYNDCGTLEEEGELWIFLAFAVIKMRLVAVSEARKNETTASTLPVDEQSRLLSDQDKQLDRLLDLIDACNPTMIPALLHPGPLLSQYQPPYYSHGGPSEAQMLLPNVVDVWNSIPGAPAYLAKRLGTATPSYATS